MERISIGKKVLEARKKLGFTQAELAEKCHFDIRTIQRIEQEEVKPRMYSLRIMSGVLGVDLTQDTDNKIIDKEVENYRKIFHKRRKFRIVTFAVTITFMVLAFLLAFPSWRLFGMPKSVWAPYFYLLIFADVLGIIISWRCPGCNSLLGEVFSTRYCSKCGLKFYD
ncbi:MAG: helix-turn-helix domain-containing protein [Ignavibacteriales bacterium]|nr:helix-turn-helix domain-containing protein [Ignavibacteriales bacterium]MCF8305107.1 helix-turn-helix domain-containing protein [Ignavibacteriales bacterium]MCF8314979.1 helix-turn-helix domain-containing protein [Ignavibacteriales bacterium]MCF8436071.1 helix-turn-helix domain-containing protein [Ignavibacteriales bacterium]